MLQTIFPIGKIILAITRNMNYYFNHDEQQSSYLTITTMLMQTPKVGDLVLYRFQGTRTDIPFRVTQVDEAKGTIVAYDEAPGGYGSETHGFDMCEKGLTNFPTDKASQDLVWKKLRAYAKRAGAI